MRTVVAAGLELEAGLAQKADVHCHQSVSSDSGFRSALASSYPTATPIIMLTRVSSTISVRTARRRSSASALAGGREDARLVRLVEPSGRVQRLIEDPLQLRRAGRDELRRRLEALRV